MPRGTGDNVVGMPVVIVAASNSSDDAKACANCLCSGSNDDARIQEGIDALPASGGTVQLTEGTFAIGGTLDPVSNLTLQGCGESTVLELGGLVTDYDSVTGSTGGGGGTAFMVISGVTNVTIRDMRIQIVSDFPDYGVGSDFIIIHAESTSSDLQFDHLHLIANSLSGNATYGIWGSADDVTINDCVEEYCARGFNASRDHAGGAAERWTLTRCKALHDPDQVPLTTSGFEFEDGVKNITAVDCYAEDIEDHGIYSGRAFTAGVHSDYAPALNEHIKIIRPTIIDCEFGFWISMTTDYVIEEPYLYSVLRPIYTGPDFTTPIYQLKIIGGDWDGCGYPLVFCTDLVCDGLTVRNGTEQQGLWFNGSGVAATIDNFIITNLHLDAAGTDRGLRLSDVNGVTITGIVSTGSHYAISLSGDYAHNVTVSDGDLRGNDWGEIQNVAVASSNIVFSGNIGYIAPGEPRFASGTLTAGNANDICFYWNNPEIQDIIIKKVVVETTTAGGTGGSQLDVGIADDAAGTNRGTEFFDDLLLHTTQIHDSWVGGDGGTQTKWVACQDIASATDDWIVGQILTQNAASLVGKFYIEYVGR